MLNRCSKKSSGRTAAHQDRHQSGRGHLLRSEVRIYAERRDRPRMAMRHDAGRLQPARAVRRLLYRCRCEEDAAGDDPSRDLRLDGALPRHPDREFCRPFAAMVLAAAGGGGDDHLGCRWLCRQVAAKLRGAASRVETDLRNEKINYKVREHSLAKVPVMLVCGKREAEEGTVNIRRLGSRDQTSMSSGRGDRGARRRGDAAGPAHQRALASECARTIQIVDASAAVACDELACCPFKLLRIAFHMAFVIAGSPEGGSREASRNCPTPMKPIRC